MASRKPSGQPRARARGLLPRVVAPLALAGLAAAQIGGAGAPAGATSQAAPTYAALGSGEPPGLTFVDPQAPRPAAGSGLTWPATAPSDAGGSWPVTASIRPLELSLAGVRAWIARSEAGGVCVMLYYGAQFEGMSAIGVACSPPAAAGAGASLFVEGVPGMDGRVIEAGVVPDGVTAVSRALADGRTSTERVSGNAWPRSGTEPPAAGSEPTAITGG